MISPKTKLALGAVLLSQAKWGCEVLASEYQSQVEANPTPWKHRLHGANKNRRASHKGKRR